MQYDFRSIETKWQAAWAQGETFRAPNPGEPTFDPSKPKCYVLDMFPYPSGIGLHVGHPLGYIATDILARYKRMRGFNVLHPMGYDAFGLPAEQFAVEHGVHPRVTTEKNIENMTRQLKRLGLSYDWSRCLSTTDVGYYKWTQWIFLQLFKSWFDPIQKKARPIDELVKALIAEDFYVTLDGDITPASLSDENMKAIGGLPGGLKSWAGMPVDEQRTVIENQRLAYLAEVPVNWCPALGTVLANEEVTNEGKSDRGNHPVFKRPLKQWMLRITAYADRLGDDLNRVDWPEPIKLMQRNWIGRSEGALVDFRVEGYDDVIRVFTTRPDTLFGATYMVLAPEHALVDEITADAQRQAVDHYRAQAASKADADRTEAKVKTGVFTGAYAVNPANLAHIPIWIADYVLTGYGTGAIMAVPAHDQRDHDFAKTFKLPIVQVITAPDDFDVQQRAWEEDGLGVNSANDEVSLDGLAVDEAKQKITIWLESKNVGLAKVQYKLRDWLFSRQRYWGEPFPILHGPDGEIEAVDESELPVELPPMENFQPSASDDPDAQVQTPLSRAPDSWKVIERDGKRYTRELNTMPQWAGSCWYYLRFCDPSNEGRFVGAEAEKYWMVSMKRDSGMGTSNPHAGGVDMYVGGAEHAVLHLLYSRFWHKVLFDLGHVSTPEPFGRLFNQGYIQAYAYTDDRGVYVAADEVVEREGKVATITRTERNKAGDEKSATYQTTFYHGDTPVVQEYGKMGKSLKNAVAPDDMCEQYGADALRLYEMYLGPLDQSKPWRTTDIVGVYRFLQRVWRNFVDPETGTLRVTDEAADEGLRRYLHRTIKRVSDSMERMSFNTAIAALIELNNELVALKEVPREVAEPMVRLLSPMAPHIAEELWERLGRKESLTHAPWPPYDPALLVESTVDYPVQVNGKMRGKITVPADADDQAIEAAARADEKVAAQLEGKTIRKVIVVKGRMVNIIAN
ncbi:MAG: leucine--tRNA ligase [Phycisphaeraceae bacterium]